MSKLFYSLGLMSGTSMDGVDASIIQSDGETKYKVIKDKYFEYNQGIYIGLTDLRDKIKNIEDIQRHSKEILKIEKEITLFHAKASAEIMRESKVNIDFIGFHGQTIFHNSDIKISKQLGDGILLSQLIKKTVIYDFRQNDLRHGGEGAPLTPIFHQMLEKNFNIKPVSFINIGGILNITTIWSDGSLSATDIGPGMCLIDKWIRTNSNKKYDNNGDIAKSGKIDKIILNQALDNFFANKNYEIDIKKTSRFIKSFDVNDFDISFVRGLSLEDGAATLTEYSAQIILSTFLANKKLNIQEKSILCGGGRKNKFLVDKINADKIKVKLIDEFGIDGDFVESQAFAYLAIRSYINLPISFPNTTGVNKPCVGGKIIKN
jgi:anhydro-N-acetylmuramic acid kinase